MDAKSHYYTKYYFVQHLANLLPIFGRDTGTGNPGIITLIEEELRLISIRLT